MRHFICFPALAVLLLGLAPPVPISPSAQRHIDDAVRTALARQHVAGASLAIVEGGTIVYEKGYGLRDVDDKLAADANTVYSIGSITKQFTAAAIMLLQQEGLLHVDDRLDKYVPNAPHASEVTLRQLLSHTSGIVGYTEQPSFSDAVREPATPQQIVETIAGQPLAFAPGNGWQYSNTNFILLGMVVEKVSGEPYERFVQEHFLQPLGMRSASFWTGDAIVSDAARGYTSYALGALYHADYWNYDWAGSAGALAMSAVDLAKWDVALDSGQAVSEESFEAMTTARPLADGTPTHYGFGLAVGSYLGRKVVAHSGAISGFITDNWTVPADRLAIVLLGNGDNFNPVPIVHDIAATLYGTDAPKMPFAPVRQPDDAAAKASALIARALTGSLNATDIDVAMRQDLKPQFAGDLVALGQRLGKPLTLDAVAVDVRPPVTTYRYRVRFADETLECDLALNTQGQIDGIDFKPWYDY